MTVTLNGEPLQLAPASTVLSVIAERTGRDNPIGVAVARNRAVVPRSQWAETELVDGDELELVGVMQGG